MAVLMMYLHNSIDERHIEEIRDVTDPADVMRRFAEKYAKISPQSKRMALNALTGFTMSDEEDWDGMKRRFGGLVHDCKLMEVELNDDLIANAFLGHPSPKWMIVVQVLAPSGDSPSLDQIFTGFANVEKIEGLFTKTPESEGNVADEGFYDKRASRQNSDGNSKGADQRETSRRVRFEEAGISEGCVVDEILLGQEADRNKFTTDSRATTHVVNDFRMLHNPVRLDPPHTIR